MEKARFTPQEVERIIDEEIARIDQANAEAQTCDRSKTGRRSPLARLTDFFTKSVQRILPSKTKPQNSDPNRLD